MKKASWDLKAYLLEQIKARGGWISAHNHLDKAYLIEASSLDQTGFDLRTKWDLIDEQKRSWTVDQIYDRICFGVEEQLKQGVTGLCTFLDVDPLIEDKSIKAAQRVRERYQNDLELKFACQTIKGVLQREARFWFDEAVAFVDIIGGLPYKDKGREEEHLDVIMAAAKRTGKMVHVHVDQLNLPSERETELLVDKTTEHGLEGKVVAVHGISIGAQEKSYRQSLYQRMVSAGVSVIACPTAWIDHRRSEVMAPTHNAVTPVDEMIPSGVIVAIGPDNIADYYKPFTDGDLWLELRVLLESCHYYELDELIKIATDNGRAVLGMPRQDSNLK